MPSFDSTSDLLRSDDVASLLSWQEDFYRDLHQHPELSHYEERTAEKIIERLRNLDCEITTGIGGYGVTAVFHNGGSGAACGDESGAKALTVLMRADFDALPVEENSGLDYASTNGAMHACGHDMHATALLGACEILDAHREAWEGTIIALFQPAEETSDGAKNMIADGLLDKVPAPDVCLGQHVMPGEAGAVLSARGPVMAGCDSLRIRISGRSAHASQPEDSVDPTFIAAMIVVRLQAIVSREVSARDFFVISVGELHSGDKNNIIPDSAELVLNTRYYDPALAERVYESLERMVRAECVASASPAEPTFEYFAHGEVTDNAGDTFDVVRPQFDAVFGDKSQTAETFNASEDFCYLPQAWNVPYHFWFVGSTPKNRMDNPPSNHQPDFIPEYAPTVYAATRAGAAALLAYLGRLHK